MKTRMSKIIAFCLALLSSAAVAGTLSPSGPVHSFCVVINIGGSWGMEGPDLRFGSDGWAQEVQGGKTQRWLLSENQIDELALRLQVLNPAAWPYSPYTTAKEVCPRSWSDAGYIRGRFLINGQVTKLTYYRGCEGSSYSKVMEWFVRDLESRVAPVLLNAKSRTSIRDAMDSGYGPRCQNIEASEKVRSEKPN